MSFDGVLMHHLKEELNLLKSGRITKIVESSDTDFIWTIRKEHTNYFLLTSFSSEYARIHLTEKKYDSSFQPKSFTMFLRKHCEGYFIEDITQFENDRILTFKIQGLNEMKDLSVKFLIFEIMGRYSNLILTDDQYKILDVLKKDGVGEYHRTMLPNATYTYPVSDKINPFQSFVSENRTFSSPKDLISQIMGISYLLAEACFQNDRVWENLLQQIHLPVQPCIVRTIYGKTDFYFHPLNYETITTFPTISQLLDQYYYEADIASIIRQKTNDLSKFIEKQIRKNEKKIAKITLDLKEAQNADEMKLKGELLLSCSDLKQKQSQITLTNYYNNEKMTISLDPKRTILENSNLYYKKYQKAKQSIHYLNEQIELAEDEMEYFRLLAAQLPKCSLNDALEIQQELTDNKYLFQKEKPLKKKKPTLLAFLVDGVRISVGKNNLQNEYLTHTVAKSDEYWFHVQNAPGSHVVIHSNNLTEHLIRTAALLAATYSSYSESSSVPVDYTQVRYIKKIPKKRACFVRYTNQKTIYIDPDKKQAEQLQMVR